MYFEINRTPILSLLYPNASQMHPVDMNIDVAFTLYYKQRPWLLEITKLYSTELLELYESQNNSPHFRTKFPSFPHYLSYFYERAFKKKISSSERFVSLIRKEIKKAKIDFYPPTIKQLQKDFLNHLNTFLIEHPEFKALSIEILDALSLVFAKRAEQSLVDPNELIIEIFLEIERKAAYDFSLHELANTLSLLPKEITHPTYSLSTTRNISEHSKIILTILVILMLLSVVLTACGGESEIPPLQNYDHSAQISDALGCQSLETKPGDTNLTYIKPVNVGGNLEFEPLSPQEVLALLAGAGALATTMQSGNWTIEALTTLQLEHLSNPLTHALTYGDAIDPKILEDATLSGKVNPQMVMVPINKLFAGEAAWYLANAESWQYVSSLSNTHGQEHLRFLVDFAKHGVVDGEYAVEAVGIPSKTNILRSNTPTQIYKIVNVKTGKSFHLTISDIGYAEPEFASLLEIQKNMGDAVQVPNIAVYRPANNPNLNLDDPFAQKTVFVMSETIDDFVPLSADYLDSITDPIQKQAIVDNMVLFYKQVQYLAYKNKTIIGDTTAIDQGTLHNIGVSGGKFTVIDAILSPNTSIVGSADNRGVVRLSGEKALWIEDDLIIISKLIDIPIDDLRLTIRDIELFSAEKVVLPESIMLANGQKTTVTVVDDMQRALYDIEVTGLDDVVIPSVINKNVLLGLKRGFKVALGTAVVLATAYEIYENVQVLLDELEQDPLYKPPEFSPRDVAIGGGAGQPTPDPNYMANYVYPIPTESILGIVAQHSDPMILPGSSTPQLIAMSNGSHDINEETYPLPVALCSETIPAENGTSARSFLTVSVPSRDSSGSITHDTLTIYLRDSEMAEKYNFHVWENATEVVLTTRNQILSSDYSPAQYLSTLMEARLITHFVADETGRLVIGALVYKKDKVELIHFYLTDNEGNYIYF